MIEEYDVIYSEKVGEYWKPGKRATVQVKLGKNAVEKDNHELAKKVFLRNHPREANVIGVIYR